MTEPDRPQIKQDKRRVLEYLQTSREFMPYLHASMPAHGAVKLLGSRDRAQRALTALVQDGKIRYLENCSPDHYQAYAEVAPLPVPDRPALGTPRQPLTTTGEILAALAQVEADAEVNPDPHPLAEAVIIPDRSDTQTGDGSGINRPVPAPPEGLIYRIAREVSGIQNWDQVRDFQAAHCAQVRKTIEVYRRLLAEDQPVQPAPDTCGMPISVDGQRLLCTLPADGHEFHQSGGVRWRRVTLPNGVGVDVGFAPASSVPGGEPETYSQEIARKHEENLRKQTRSDYEAIQEAKRFAPAPERVVSDPGREREGCGHAKHAQLPGYLGRAGRVEDDGGGLMYWEPCPLPGVPTPDQTATEWAVIAYDVEKEADRVGICEDEADARELLAYQQRSMRLRDARIVTRNATPWLPFQTETEEQS